MIENGFLTAFGMTHKPEVLLCHSERSEESVFFLEIIVVFYGKSATIGVYREKEVSLWTSGAYN